jgi:hypothetical protein
VNAFERIVRQLLMIEGLDLEGLRDVTPLALALGRRETKLSGVNVAVAPPALTWRAAVGGTLAFQPVLLRGAVTTFTSRLRVNPGQRPRAVIDSWRFPASLGVAMRTSSVTHLDRELLTMRVVVAVDAALRSDSQVVPRSLAPVTAGAADRLMLAVQRELGAAVLRHREQGRPEPVLVVARGAVGGSEAASMDVAMAVAALLKLQAPISPLHRELG